MFIHLFSHIEGESERNEARSHEKSQIASFPVALQQASRNQTNFQIPKVTKVLRQSKLQLNQVIKSQSLSLGKTSFKWETTVSDTFTITKCNTSNRSFHILFNNNSSNRPVRNNWTNTSSNREIKKAHFLRKKTTKRFTNAILTLVVPRFTDKALVILKKIG